jgi:hypothetical protein
LTGANNSENIIINLQIILKRASLSNLIALMAVLADSSTRIVRALSKVRGHESLEMHQKQCIA